MLFQSKLLASAGRGRHVAKNRGVGHWLPIDTDFQPRRERGTCLPRQIQDGHGVVGTDIVGTQRGGAKEDGPKPDGEVRCVADTNDAGFRLR